MRPNLISQDFMLSAVIPTGQPLATATFGYPCAGASAAGAYPMHHQTDAVHEEELGLPQILHAGAVQRMQVKALRRHQAVYVWTEV